MAERASLSVSGVSPKFFTALESLIEAHIEDLKKFSDSNGEDKVYPSQEGAESTVQCLCSEESFQMLQLETDRSQQKTETGTHLTGGSICFSHPKGEAERGHVALAAMPSVAQSISLRSRLREAAQFAMMRVPTDTAQMVHRQGAGMFGSMRDALQSDAQIDEHEYDVSQCYHSEGIMQAIARSYAFANLTLTVIAINAGYLGVDADFNTATSLNKADRVFIACENAFAAYFTLELVVRFCAFEKKRDCLSDNWFKFDLFLLSVIWVETWILPLLEVFFHIMSQVPTDPLRMLRLLRLARMVRIMRAFPELMIMIKGMLVATRAVGSAMFLLIIAVYAGAIAMHSLMKDDEALFMYWGTVTRCMMTLMSNGILGDSIGDVMRGVARNVPALTVLIVFIIFSAFTVVNMLVGVLCEVVSEVASAERESVALDKLKCTLLVMLKTIDADGSGDITRDELLELFQDESAKSVLIHLKIDIEHFVDMLDMHLDGSESMTIASIMRLLIEKQGERTVTVQDMCSFSTFSRWSMHKEFGKEFVGMRQDMASMRQLLEGEHISRKASPRHLLIGERRAPGKAAGTHLYDL